MRIMSQNCLHVVCVVVFTVILWIRWVVWGVIILINYRWKKREIISLDDIETWESDNK